MRIISFSVLKDKLLEGTKTQTIRRPRKNPLRVSEMVQIYWKLRSKDRLKLFNAVITSIDVIKLTKTSENVFISDGFTSKKEALDWFKSKYPKSWTSKFKLIKFRKLSAFDEWIKNEKWSDKK